MTLPNTSLPDWAANAFAKLSAHLPLTLDPTARAYALLNDAGTQWHVEVSECPDQLLLHCELDATALQRDVEGLRTVLASHHQPQRMQGACIALDPATGVLRLLQSLPATSPLLDDLHSELMRLQGLRAVFVSPN